MTQQNTEEQDSLNPDGEEDTLEPQDLEDEPQEPKEPEAPKEDPSKFKQLAENYKARAEKAERRLKETEQVPEADLSQTDLYHLIKADVPEESFEEITDYAKLKSISVSEALKSSVIRNVLAEKREELKTAKATATDSKRKGASSPSGDELLDQARRGQMPDTDEDIQRLVEARFQSRVKK